MGVKGLWKLLLPIGRRISLETLEGQILAIDASIWLTQFLKALRDPQTGQSQPAAHLIGFLRRLCRLYYHGIRPVLVFDGATPEIKQREVQNRRKRRELFAQAHGEAGTKRLARRLLSQNLQKLKKTTQSQQSSSTGTNRGGLAPGFNPGGQVRADSSTTAASTATAEASPSTAAAAKPSLPPTSAQDEAAILAAIRQDLEAAEAEEQQRMLSQNTNDFDIVMGNDSTAAVTTVGQPEDSDDDKVEYEDFGVPRNRQTSLHIFSVPKGRDIDVAYIASLPVNERKDAVEEAKRRQRMQSRREFMPAAGDPDQFSSVQLQNFLKSSRLNLDLQKMAKAEVQRNNRHGGDYMASDLTTRISLIRETDKDEDNDDTAIENDPLFQRGAAAKRRNVLKLSHQDSSDDEEEEEPIETGTKKPSSTSPSPRAKKRRVIEDDDDDDDDDDDLVDANREERHHDDEGGFKKESRAPSHGFLPLEGYEFESAGGFVPSEPNDNVNPSVAASTERKAASTNRFAIEIYDDDEPSRASSEGGGFLMEDPDPSKSREDIESEKTNQSTTTTSEPDTTRDAAIAQELSDAMLAQALQQEEEHRLEVAQEPPLESSRKQYALTLDDDSSVEVLGDTKKSNPEEEKKESLSNRSDDSSEEMDWKDGDDVSIDNSPPTDDMTAPRVSENNARVSNPATGHVEQSAKNVTFSVDEHQSSKEKEGQLVGSDSDDEEEWVDGEEASNGESSVEYEKKYIDHGHSEPGADDSSPYFDTGKSSNTETRGSELDSSGWAPEVEFTENFTSKVAAKTHSSDETSAAFARAEATAANLAGWAGRAFRRAMKETGQYAPKETLPSDDIPVQAVNAPENERDASPSIPNPPRSQVKTTAPVVGTSRNPRKNRSAMTDQQIHTQSGLSSEEKRAATSALLEQYEADWAKERNQSERDMDTVTDEMKEEAMLLLRLFGVPYVVSPAEAEAQCAVLEQLGLVDGIVTEDSDVFVFGGKKVYKNIFEERKYAEAYMSEDAEREMSIGRNAMVALAMLLGSDYTEGVKGVGIVNSMEILQAFDVSEDLEGGLKSFRTWLDGFDPSDIGLKGSEGNEESSPQKLFHAKHKSARSRWVAPENFPGENIISAYVNPVVDKSPEKFSWGIPDVEGLVLFCGKHMGWPEAQTRRTLEPVVERLQRRNRYRQTRLDSFMRYEDSIKFADVKSKRLREVLGLSDNQAKPPPNI